MFTIDGTQWPYPCSIRRTAEIKSTDVSGDMLDGTYFNDVKGTYFVYAIKLTVPLNDINAYTSIYEKLTDPVDGHVFVFPYGQSSITIMGRIENVDDSYVRLAYNGKYWRDITFTVTANAPTKTMTLSQIIQRGRAMTPEIAEHSEGDTWIWVNGRWELSVSYRNADTTKY